MRAGARGARARARATVAVQLFEAPGTPPGSAFGSFLEGALHALEVERNQAGFSGAAVLRSLASGAAEASGDPAEPPFSYLSLAAFEPDFPSAAAFFEANDELEFVYGFALPEDRHFFLCSEVGSLGGSSSTGDLQSRPLDSGLVLVAALKGAGGEDELDWASWSGAGGLQGEPGFASAVLLRNDAVASPFSHLLLAEFDAEAGDGAALLGAYQHGGGEHPAAAQADVYRWHYAFGGRAMVGVAAALADQKRAGGAGSVAGPQG